MFAKITAAPQASPKVSKRSLLFLLGLSAAIISLAQSLYVPLLPELQIQLHTSMALVNLTVTVFTIAMAVMQIVLGPIVDRSGRKKVLIPGLIVYVLATIGCLLSGSIEMLLAFRVMQGIGASVVPLIAATMIGDLFEGKERAESMATYQMILGISPALGPLIGGLIGEVAGYIGVFGFAAGTALIVLLLSLLILPETKPAGSVDTAEKNGLSDRTFSAERRPPGVFRSFGHIFRNKTGAIVLLSGFVLYDVFYTLIVFLPTILQTHYGLSAAQIGFFPLLFMALSLVGSRLSGRLQNQLESGKMLVLTGSAIGVSLILFLIAAPLSLIALGVSLALTGFASGLMMPVLPTLLSAEFVQERATAIGVYNFVRYLGMAAAPMIGSLLYPLGGIPLLIGITAALIGLSSLYAARR